MCIACEAGGLHSPLVADKIHHAVAEFGVAITGVDGFLYTVGLTVRGWPEFVLSSNLDTDTAHFLLNYLSQQCFHRNQPYAEGAIVGLAGSTQRVRMQNYAKLDNLAVIPVAYPHVPYTALQVVPHVIENPLVKPTHTLR